MNPKIVLKDFENNFRSKRKKQKEKFNFWVNSTYMIMLALIWIMLIYYVWIINTNATKGYNIRELEKEKINLLIEKELLDVKIAELESLDTIKDWMIDEMEEVEEPDYLVIKEWVQYVYNN